MQAAYRFFDNDRVTFAKVLQPHVARSLERVRQQEVVLFVQDSSEIDLTRPGQDVAGAGALDGARSGFLLHEMQAFTPDGTPLGTVWAEVINRTAGVSHAPAAEKRRRRQQQPIEAKESMRWLTGLRQARALARQCPGTRCVCVADSEADIYELFAEPRGEPPLHWLIRACQDRAVDRDPGNCLRARVLTTPALYEVGLLVRGRHAKTAAETRARRQDRPARKANVEVRAGRVTLRPPYRPDGPLPPVTVNVVLVREPNPPPGATAVEWVLVTTLPIDAPGQVKAVVGYYCVRWCIEVYFRTLKSGCRIERRRFEHIDRVLPCLGLFLIVSWRTLLVCRLGRACPEVGCEALFEPSEWKAVWAAVHRKRPPKKVPRLQAIVQLIASLGGHVKRRDGEPGVQTMWVGLQRMYDLAWAWDAFGPDGKVSGA
jgi:hypothetical protein